MYIAYAQTPIVFQLIAYFFSIGVTRQNVCTYFCHLESWKNQSMACGLVLPETMQPNYISSPIEVYQIAKTAGELVDSVWTTAANGISVDASTPAYGCKARYNYREICSNTASARPTLQH